MKVELAYETMYIYHLLVITHCLGDTMTGLAGVDHSNLLFLMHTHTYIVFQRLNAHLHAHKTPPYVVNLDPAVREVPFPTNIGALSCDHCAVGM